MNHYSHRVDPYRAHPPGLPIHIPDVVAGKFSKPISLTSHQLSVRMLADTTPHIVGNSHPLGKPIVQRTLPDGTIERGEFLSTASGEEQFLAEGLRLQPNGLCSAGEFADGPAGENLLDHGLIIQLRPGDHSRNWPHLSTGHYYPQTYRGIQLLETGLQRMPNALLSGHFNWEDDRGHLLMFGHMLYPDGSGVDILAGDPLRPNAHQFIEAAVSMYPEAADMQAKRNSPDKPLNVMKSIFIRELKGLQAVQPAELQSCTQSQIKTVELAKDKRELMVAVIRAVDAIEPIIRQMTTPDLTTCRHLGALYRYLSVVASRGKIFKA